MMTCPHCYAQFQGFTVFASYLRGAAGSPESQAPPSRAGRAMLRVVESRPSVKLLNS
jgi:hypothetical protein